MDSTFQNKWSDNVNLQLTNGEISKMNRFALLVVTLATLFLAVPAFADNNCVGFGDCQDNDVTNNIDNSVGPAGNFSPTASAAGGGGGAAQSASDASALGLGVAGAGVFDSGNSSNANRNLNDSNFGNSASGSFAGVGDVGNNSGNSSSDSSATAFGAQGQMQGQLGILDNTNTLDNGNEISTSTSTSTKTNQDQTAVGTVDSHDSVTVEGDDIVYESPDIPVNSAAPVFAGACSQGVSVQTQSFGGSAGTTNPVCDYVAVAGGFIAAGDRDDALRVLGKAEDAADWRYRFSQIRSVLTLGLL